MKNDKSSLEKMGISELQTQLEQYRQSLTQDTTELFDVVNPKKYAESVLPQQKLEKVMNLKEKANKKVKCCTSKAKACINKLKQKVQNDSWVYFDEKDIPDDIVAEKCCDNNGSGACCETSVKDIKCCCLGLSNMFSKKENMLVLMLLGSVIVSILIAIKYNSKEK